MRRKPWALAVVLCSWPLVGAVADAPDAGVASPADGGSPDDEQLKKELEQSLQQDARAKAAAAAAAQQGGGTSTSGAAPIAPSAGPQGTVARGAQSLNPDMSVILDGNAGYERRGVSYRNGDDPDLHG